MFAAKLLKNKRAKLIIFCNTGSHQGYMLACKEFSVPTIDIQHCHISYYNLLYNYSNELDKEKKELILCPDYIFTWSDFWNNNINITSKKVSIGYPYFENKVNGLNNKIIKKKFKTNYFYIRAPKQNSI